MTLQRTSPCKVNLLLNLLGLRADGFHELETVMQPVPLTDELEFSAQPSGITLTCNRPDLPVDGSNLVHRAATAFLAEAGVTAGVRVHLEKRLPLAAGLGGGSANAAVTLRGLNDLFGVPLDAGRLHCLAAGLGSDVPFFLQDGPALATGRGECVEPLAPFASLQGRGLVLVHPGFGVSTPWAYQQMARFPEARDGRPGRARELAAALTSAGDPGVFGGLYNALEGPVLEKHPLLRIFQDFFREQGALGTLVSGSGSTTFAVAKDGPDGARIAEGFRGRFGPSVWLATVAL